MAAINEAELTLAIERTLVARGKLTIAEARPTARMVLGYFGADDSVLDNKLASDDRDRFYQLEEEGLLSSEEEDATVSRGKTWRIHYWLMQKARVREVARAGTETPPEDDGSVYRAMVESDWKRGEDAPRNPDRRPA